MRSIAVLAVGLSLFIPTAQGDANAKSRPRPVADAQAEPAPELGTVAAAAIDDPGLATLLAAMEAEQRALIAVMSLDDFNTALDTPEHSRTYEQDTVVNAVNAAATVGYAASTNPELAAVLETMPSELRERALQMRFAQLLELSQLPPEEVPAEHRDVMQAFTVGFGAAFDRSLQFVTGEATLDAANAKLILGDEFQFLGPKDTVRVLTEAWGNPPPAQMPIGMVVPVGMSVGSADGFGVIVDYIAEGHVEDDDADDIDYDELLEQMKAGEEQDNATRRAAGLPELHLVGWATKPHYDAKRHRLYWARELSTPGESMRILNYDVRVLGRKGVLALNAVGTMDQLDTIGPAMETLLDRVEFEPGGRYEDFDPDIDEVAAYGIGGLVAGKLALKTGLFAGLLKILVAAKKLLIALGAAIVAGVAALFRKRRARE